MTLLIIELIITNFIVLSTAAIFYNLGKNSSKNTDNTDDFQDRMAEEYQRGLNTSSESVLKLTTCNDTLKKQLQDFKDNYSIVEAERDQANDQVEDLIEEQKQLKMELVNTREQITKLDGQNLELQSQNKSLLNQLDQLRNNHDVDLIEHGNTIREETQDNILEHLTDYLDSMKRKVEPSNQIKESNFKVSAVGSYTDPEKAKDTSISLPMELTQMTGVRRVGTPESNKDKSTKLPFNTPNASGTFPF